MTTLVSGPTLKGLLDGSPAWERAQASAHQPRRHPLLPLLQSAELLKSAEPRRLLWSLLLSSSCRPSPVLVPRNPNWTTSSGSTARLTLVDSTVTAVRSGVPRKTSGVQTSSWDLMEEPKGKAQPMRHSSIVSCTPQVHQRAHIKKTQSRARARCFGIVRQDSCRGPRPPGAAAPLTLPLFCTVTVPVKMGAWAMYCREPPEPRLAS